MPGNRRDSHLAEEELQPYVAGELDPARRAAIDKHLSHCGECSTKLEHVRSVHEGLLAGLRPVEPDELSWHRLREQVRTQLEDEARTHSQTADLALRKRWVAVGVAAVVFVALGATLIPRNKNKTKTLGGPIALVAEAPKVYQAQNEGVKTSLEEGWALELEPHTTVRRMGNDTESVELWLERGQLSMRPTLSVEPKAVRVSTPKFAVDSAGGDFIVGYWSDRYRVESRHGELIASGGPFAEKTRLTTATVRAGPWEAPAPAIKTPAPVKAKAPSRARTPPAPTSEVEEVDSAEVDTVVEAVAVGSASMDAWRRAQIAYYRDRDLEASVLYGRQAMKEATPPRKREAAQLVCDALVTANRAQEAVVACKELLALSDGDTRRAVHHRLATLYRSQLGDCVRALPHYDKLVTFGQVGPLQDELRLLRAGCAIEAGRIEVAERDAAMLAERKSMLVRPEALTELQQKLRKKRQPQLETGSNSADGAESKEREND